MTTEGTSPEEKALYYRNKIRAIVSGYSRNRNFAQLILPELLNVKRYELHKIRVENRGPYDSVSDWLKKEIVSFNGEDSLGYMVRIVDLPLWYTVIHNPNDMNEAPIRSDQLIKAGFKKLKISLKYFDDLSRNSSRDSILNDIVMMSNEEFKNKYARPNTDKISYEINKISDGAGYIITIHVNDGRQLHRVQMALRDIARPQ